MAKKISPPDIRKTCERIVHEEIWKDAAAHDIKEIERFMRKTKRKKPASEMTLNQLLRIVDGAYPDGFTAKYWDPKAQEINEGASGDTLAEFIVREIAECCAGAGTSRAMLTEALRVMEKAKEELEDVCAALSDKLAKVEA